jgi:hypothetical protein
MKALKMLAALGCALVALGAPLAHADSAVTQFSFGVSTQAAGAHPDATTKIRFQTGMFEGFPGYSGPSPYPLELLKRVRVDLPPGVLGDLSAFPTCTDVRLEANECGDDSQVGVLKVWIGAEIPSEENKENEEGFFLAPVFNLDHGPGHVGRLAAAIVSGLGIVHINLSLRDSSDYGVTAELGELPSAISPYAAELRLWGDPSAATHDGERASCYSPARGNFTGYGEPEPNCVPKGSPPPRPFMLNPTRCGDPGPVGAIAEFYETPGVENPASASLGSIEGCGTVPFEPSIGATLGGASAGAPTGLGIHLAFGQAGLRQIGGIAASALRAVRVALPEGMTLNPAAASGLVACTDQQMGFGEEHAVECPEASRIGTVVARSPLIDEALEGGVFLGSQLSGDPESGQMFRLFLELANPALGVSVKLPGKIVVGRSGTPIVASFEELPQLPVESVDLQLKEGPRAPLVAPGCGTYPLDASMTPWSGAAPAQVSASLSVGSACGAGGFTPGLRAGVANPVAGASSPFTLTVSGGAGGPNLERIEATLPLGLLAHVGEVPLCPDGAAASGSCGAASQVGSVSVAVGPGELPLVVPQPGRRASAAYLAGSYRGAPYSLVFTVPAEAGPFDLGQVVVRAALRVDPLTAQVSAVSDPLPQALSGVPLRYRQVAIAIDRPGFMVNPTSCAESAVSGLFSAAGGATASAADRFQVGECAALPFKPTLAVRLKGRTRRGGNPQLTATLRQPAGGANLAGASVVLPRSEFLAQQHIKTVCTRVQFAAEACPEASIYGYAEAWSPLLARPLSGPVYLRSNGGERQLPDLVADLHGEIDVTLVGFIDSVKAGKEGSRVRTRFQSIPDAPVSRFVLRMKGGKSSLIENSANLCRTRQSSDVTIRGQNGAAVRLTPRLDVACGRKRASP